MDLMQMAIEQLGPGSEEYADLMERMRSEHARKGGPRSGALATIQAECDAWTKAHDGPDEV